MTINNTQNNKFEEGIQALRKVSLAPEAKGVLFKTLLTYAEKHPAPAKLGIFASILRVFKSFRPAKLPVK